MSDENNNTNDQINELGGNVSTEELKEETNKLISENKDTDKLDNPGFGFIDSTETSVFEGHEKKKNNNMSKIIISSAIVAAVLIIGIVSFIIYNNPKAKVTRALNDTSKELSSSKTFLDKMSGGEDMFLAHKESGGAKENLVINILDSNIEEFSELGTMGFNITALTDSKNKKEAAEIAVNYNGADLGNINFYTDNNEFMINIPQIYDKWVTFDCKNIQDQYNNSVLGRYGEKMPSDEISLNLFDDEETELATYKEIKDIIIKNYFKEKNGELKSILEDIEVEKLDESKNISINGENQKCRAYSVFISKNEVNRFLESIYSYAETDKQAEYTLRKLVEDIIDIDELKTISSHKYSQKTIEDIVSYLRENFSLDDVNMKVYIDNKGRAAGIDLNTKINTESKKNVAFNLSTEYKGKENIFDDVKLILSIDDSVSKIDLDVDLKKENQGAMTKNIVTGTLSDGKGVLNIDCNMAYDVSNESLNGTMKFSCDGDDLLIEYDGSYNFNTSDKKVSFNLNNINLEFDNDDGKNEYLTLGCSYAIEPLNDEVKEPEGDKFEIFKANENEVVGAVFEIEQKLNQFKQAVNI